MYQLEQTQMNAKRKLSFLGDTHGDFNIITEAHAIARAKDSFLVHVGDVGLDFQKLLMYILANFFLETPKVFPPDYFLFAAIMITLLLVESMKIILETMDIIKN